MRVIDKNGQPPPLITLYEQKTELFAKSGLDVLICIPFDMEFAAIKANDFVEDLLVKRIGMKAIVVGKDYSFGKNREGNLDFLKVQADRLGFELIVSDWVQVSEDPLDRISSTRIRELVMAGKVSKARKLLGRHYQIRGTVKRGRDRGGKLLGFPTANINLTDELCPKTGVYAVTVECRDTVYQGVANIGFSPTFDDHIFTVEVHILDYSGNLYEEKIRVNFIKRIREEEKFSNLSELSRQIEQDIKTGREILSSL
jgi:riboflavin kinase / FMN adenylyltransferase